MKTITVHSAARRARGRGLAFGAFPTNPAAAEAAGQQRQQSAETIKAAPLERILIVISP
jgi:hypothetical protein